MIIKENVKLGTIAWLSTLNGGGYIKCLYEPESINELAKLCRDFYKNNTAFDLIGHTSNTLYSPDYICDNMVSTRKLTHYDIQSNCIVCECGVAVRPLSLACVRAGIKGFEGLIDLPGTLGAAIYGNAGCFGCSISRLLMSCKILNNQGVIEEVGPEWFSFQKRSSVLKRHERNAIILEITLKREDGDKDELIQASEKYHAIRRTSQPEAKNSLGSIFAESGKPTFIHRLIALVTKPYAILLRINGKSERQIADKRKKLIFILLGANDVEPYVRTWNWFQWSDERAHPLFWKFIKLHKRMFTRSELEIEIRR